jgi:hypothetical protein
MKNTNDNVFFNKISQKIKRGDFDQYFTLPFMSKELLMASIKGKLDKKTATGATPILSDADIQDSIQEVKETALSILSLYIKNEFITVTEKGLEFTKKGYNAIKEAYRS